MHNKTSFSPTLSASLFLLVISQWGPALAADGARESMAAPQVYYPGYYQSYQTPPPGGWNGYIQQQETKSQQEAAAEQEANTSDTAVQQEAAAATKQAETTPVTGTEAYGAAPVPQPVVRGRPAPPPRGYTPPGYGSRYYGRDRGYGRRRGGDRPGGFSAPWGGDRGGMPWSSDRGGRSMPWDSGRGGRNMPWDSGRGGWMDKDRFSDRWDDILNAPSDMGELPGGYRAPTVSTPNPVDVGDEFDDAARDVPGQMRNVYDDNRRRNRDDW